MENNFENKIKRGIEKFEGKSVKFTISGIIESKFYMKSVKYEIEEGIVPSFIGMYYTVSG